MIVHLIALFGYNPVLCNNGVCRFQSKGTSYSSRLPEMLYERNAYQKKDDRAARSPVSSRGFEISMKSQFYHSSRFTSPFFNLIVYICVCICVCMYFSLLFFFSLFLLFPRYFFLAQSRARFACRRSEVTTYSVTLTSCEFFVQSRTREIARSSHGIKYATEREMYRVALSQSCSNGRTEDSWPSR